MTKFTRDVPQVLECALSVKTLVAKFMHLNKQLCLLDYAVIFLCLKTTCFHDS